MLYNPVLVQEMDQVSEEIVVEDKYTKSNLPFEERQPALHMLRAFITQFDGSQSSIKMKENGVEHTWMAEDSSIFQSSEWKTNFIDTVESIKEIRYTETDIKKLTQKDPNIIKGSKDGTNKYGQYWKEDWEIN